MKRGIGILWGLFFWVTFSVQGQGQPGLTAEKRAQHLTDKMVRELRLNNYQARKVKNVNQELVNKLISLESQYQGNPTVLEEKCQEVCRERDVALEKFLSTDQYSQFYGIRTTLYNADREFAAKERTESLNMKQDPAGKGLDTDRVSSQKKPRPKNQARKSALEGDS
ncbi:hypothetical protein BH24BAC1_BH24BAC1_07140 [soil metagenome]